MSNIGLQRADDNVEKKKVKTCVGKKTKNNEVLYAIVQHACMYMCKYLKKIFLKDQIDTLYQTRKQVLINFLYFISIYILLETCRYSYFFCSKLKST